MAEQAYWKRRDLSPAQRWKNWWWYHWKHALIAAVALAAACTVVRDQVTRVEPDCTVALVTRRQPSGQELASLQAELERWAPDANGDGQVLVEVSAIQIDYAATDLSPEALKVMEANVDKLNFDFYTRQSGVFLLEDPANFQRSHQALAYLDGSTPPEGAEDWERMTRPWTDWPGSASVELETRLWFGRRIITGEEDRAAFAGADALWNALFP